MNIYADTNYFTFLYLEDAGSGKAQALLRPPGLVLPVTWLLRMEIINSFQQAVFSGFGEKQQRVTVEMAAACQGFFRDDLREGALLRQVEAPLAAVTRHFEEISLRHTARHGFRTYDILHVASALTLHSRMFWSFDKRACKLAKLEGLNVI